MRMQRPLALAPTPLEQTPRLAQFTRTVESLLTRYNRPKGRGKATKGEQKDGGQYNTRTSERANRPCPRMHGEPRSKHNNVSFCKLPMMGQACQDILPSLLLHYTKPRFSAAGLLDRNEMEFASLSSNEAGVRSLCSP